MKKILAFINVFFGVVLFYTQAVNSENYIQTRTYLEAVTASSSTAKQVQTVEYFDGLGRPKQTVNVKASPLQKDVVTHIEYDGFGRQVKNYLPVPQTFTDNGSIFWAPLGNASNPAVYGPEKIYSEKVLENSPLNRIQQQIQVGNDWSQKPVKFDYDANIAGEVIKFITTTTWLNNATKSEINNSGSYGASQLYKNTVTDEDGNKTIEFKNGEGQTILVRKVMSAFVNADTYYVYNEYNQLAFVIPPTASNPVLITLDESTLNNLCYQYRYDGRKRLVEKKLPGKGWELMVYDKQDRLVLTQDALLGTVNNNFGAKGWLFTKYDRFGRIVYNGFFKNTASRNSMQTALNSMQANAGNNESRSNNSFMLNGIEIYYDNAAFPTGSMTVLGVNYYDTYPPLPADVNVPATIPVLTDNHSADKSTKTFPLVSYVKNIEDDNWTKNYTWYDTKGRAISSHSVNHLGGYTKTEYDLDFAGVQKQLITWHKRLNSDTEKIIKENFTFDHQNRLKTHTHQIDNNPVEYLAQNDYNEISQLKSKFVGGATLGSGHQTVDYTYNIRGWMTGINNPNNLGDDLFGYKIKYTQIEGLENPNTDFMDLKVKPRYNGNIAEVDWKTSTTPSDNLRRYGYVYDNLNRLLAGFYQKDTNPSAKEYFEKMTYDLNGNIIQLKRSGQVLPGTTTAMMFDDLDYYYLQGNRLLSVTDYSSDDSGYPQDLGDAISYDLNGNMTIHPDKSINFITYNHLNLPSVIGSDSNGAQTEYLYSAAGVKLRKNYILATALYNQSTDYLEGFQYLTTNENLCIGCLNPLAVLQFIPTSEGYFDFVKNKYIYSYIDHLGNTRLSYFKNISGSIEVLEENNYYPFGLKHDGYNQVSGSSAYQYKYNGKELQETGMYDYGARMYMPDIGRWGVMDGKGELYLSKSPYSYANNTPVNAIDPDGNLVIFINGQHGGSGGSPEYWRQYEGRWRFNSNLSGAVTYRSEEVMAFDRAVMSQLGDYRPKYVDGAMGGWSNTLFATKNVNTSATNRINSGFKQGKNDAAEIIKNLARDESTGAIIETIKIITHSMGGAYGKGYVKALKEYISTLPKEQQKQIKITLVADFDPFQAGSLTVDPNIKTQQFIHEGNGNIKGMGWLANEQEQGISDKDTHTNTGSSTDHSALTFLNDISKLQEGTYRWNGSSWACTNCNH